MVGKRVGAALTKYNGFVCRKLGGVSLKPDRWLYLNFLGPDKESLAVQ